MRKLNVAVVVCGLAGLGGGTALADGTVDPASSGSAAVTVEQCMTAVATSPGLAKDLGEATLGADVAAKRRAQLDKEAGERRAQQDAEARDQTTRQIALDQRQVIMAYAAMWIVAAGFVVFLWRKQGGLKTEIAVLRRELEDAVAREAAATKKAAAATAASAARSDHPKPEDSAT